MGAVAQGIEPLDGAGEEDLVHLPEAAREREGAHQEHQGEPGEGGGVSPPDGSVG
jgi:hypothetical protein